MNDTYKVCVAGFGQKTSVWLHFCCGLRGCSIEEPRNQQYIPTDEWFSEHFLLVPVALHSGPKSAHVLPYLTLKAGRTAAIALRDYKIEPLSNAFVSHYGWQIANRAEILPTCCDELAKVYAGHYAVYLYPNRQQLERAVRHWSKSLTCVVTV